MLPLAGVVFGALVLGLIFGPIGKTMVGLALGAFLLLYHDKIPVPGWSLVILWIAVKVVFLFISVFEEQHKEKVKKWEKALGGAKMPSALSVLAPDFNSPADIKAAKESVFTIKTMAGHGSGFFISSGGWALTNRHVVESDEYFGAVFLKNGKELTRGGRLFESYEEPDIAIVKIDAPRGKPLRLNFDLPKEGDDIFVIGTPLDSETLKGTVTKGVVSAIREEDGETLIQSDAVVHPGNSGGPMLDAHGNVVAVTVSKREEGGINFFIPVKDALAAIKTRQVKAIDKIT